MAAAPDALIVVAPDNNAIIQGANQYDVLFATTSNSQGFSFGYSNSYLRISSNGNIGIGTNTPTYPLHVGGVAGSISVYSIGDVSLMSDRNVKTNLEVIPEALHKISSISGYTYERVDMETDRRFAGLIAQEVEKVLPEVISTGDNGQKSISYGNVTALLVQAIKELNEEVINLRSKISAIENK